MVQRRVLKGWTTLFDGGRSSPERRLKTSTNPALITKAPIVWFTSTKDKAFAKGEKSENVDVPPIKPYQKC